MKGRVVQINVSPGGAPKLPVPSARVTTDGLEGDGHRDLEHHGGPERALCLFSLDPGWSRVYAKVLQPGPIKQGDPVRLLDPS